MTTSSPNGWAAFKAAQPPQESTRPRLDPLAFDRVTLVDVKAHPDGGAEFVVVGWSMEGGRPAEATTGTIGLAPLAASFLRKLLDSWPPGEHDYVFTRGWPSVRPTLVGSVLHRLAEMDPGWHSTILGEIALLRGNWD